MVDMNREDTYSLYRDESFLTSSQGEYYRDPELTIFENIANQKESLEDSLQDDINNYEVEEVIDFQMKGTQGYFLIKWKGWDSKDNTWEPIGHLNNCSAVLISFYKKRCIELLRTPSSVKIRPLLPYMPKIKKAAMAMLIRMVCYIKSSDIEVLREQEGLVKSVASPMRLCHMMFEAVNLGSCKKSSSIMKDIWKYMGRRAVYFALLKQTELLDDWVEKLNSAALILDNAPITVENTVDLEGPPMNFTYINDYIPGKGIIIPDDPPIGCTCTNCMDCPDCCCYAAGSRTAYKQDGTLKVPIGTPIYECNKRCSCSKDCPNRIVQNGRKVQLAIFRTSNNCGWGVKAMESIKKGTFITTYVGEVITNEEAERRGSLYDAVGHTYLFDLDYHGDSLYTVDAVSHGNISHFINHSCDPNAAVFAVYIDCLDISLHKIALFATRYIKKGEEITFDYQKQLEQTMKNIVHSDENHLKNKTLCKCGSMLCKKYVF